MGYTFGGATSDDVNVTVIASGGSATQLVIGGWFYPTTLTAGRCYLSVGNTIGVLVGTTTSELQYILDCATTDPVWDTTGAGITTNKWWFFAVLSSQVNGATAAVRVWVGDEETPPREVTVTNSTAASGNYSTGNALTVGNRGTGTVAIEGDAAEVFLVQAGTNSSNISSLWVATNGTIADSEAYMVKRHIIDPAWAGRISNDYTTSPGRGSITTGNNNFVHVPLSDDRVAYGWGQNTSNLWKVGTVNGAVFTKNHPARRYIGAAGFWPYVASA